MRKFFTLAILKAERFCLPRTARIQSSWEFALVRAEGRSVRGRFFRLSAARNPGQGGTKFGLLTPRRVGGAVTRNHIRRRLREICRQYRANLSPDWLVVVIASSPAAKATFSELREEWLILARRLSILSGSR